MKNIALNRRRLLCCGALAATGLFTQLGQARPALSAAAHELAHQALQGLDPTQLWDVHCHLLGNGDSGSGCRLHPSLDQWWHPLEFVRKRAILKGAGVAGDANSVDRAYVERLLELTQGFPPGARWLLFAFEQAHDGQGRARPESSTFHVPNDYAAAVAAAHPERFGFVASIHPYRPDALQALERARQQGALAVKWLPSSMGIDPRDRRCAPFYAALARHGIALIAHCGDEHAVPGLNQQHYGNPLRLRLALEQGVRVVVAHCASLGDGEDLDARSRRRRSNFELFTRLLDEGHANLYGDLSAISQVNRRAEIVQTLLSRPDWAPRLLHGSDHPLPGLSLLTRPASLARAGLLDAERVDALERLREHNPLLFDLALKRSLRWRGQGFDAAVFHTARAFAAPSGDTARRAA